MKSIRITIIILSSIICYSCGPEIALNNIDPEFQEYVDIYFDEGRKRSIYSIGEVVPLEIQFVTQDELSSPTTLGVCLGFGGNRIRISRLNWGDLQENEKEALISHEIGHCLLSRSHTTDIIRDCNCQSIMQAGGGGSSCIRDLKSTVWRDYYYDELFNLTDPPISIRRTDFSDWSRTPLFQFQDSIPLNINLEENPSIRTIDNEVISVKINMYANRDITTYTKQKRLPFRTAFFIPFMAENSQDLTLPSQLPLPY